MPALRLSLGLALSLVLCLAIPTGPAEACCEDGDFSDQIELPDEVRVQFRTPRGSFYPQRLILVGPREALAARLPRRAKPRDENRLPLSAVPGVGKLFKERPVIDRLGPGSRLGWVYRRGDALVAVFDSEGAYRDAHWRLRRKVAVVTRLSRGRGLASMRLGLDFASAGRGGVPRGGLGPRVGAVHGADAVLAITPLSQDLPRGLF